MSGFMEVVQDEVKVRVEWPGGALTVPQFVEAMETMSRTWAAINGRRTGDLLAASLTYDSGED